MYTRTLEQDLNGATSFSIDSRALSITVVTQRRSSIRVELEADDVPGSEDARAIDAAWLGTHGYRSIHLTAHAPESKSFRSYGGDTVIINNTSYDRASTIRVVVYVPVDIVLDVNLIGGNLYVDGAITKIAGRLSGGNVQFQEADRLDLDLSGGRVDGEIVNVEADVHSLGGNIRITLIRGRVELKTSGGDVIVGTVHGDGSIKSSGGNLSLAKFYGRQLTMNTSGGDISHPEHAGITARTTGGRVNGKSASFW